MDIRLRSDCRVFFDRPASLSKGILQTLKSIIDFWFSLQKYKVNCLHQVVSVLTAAPLLGFNLLWMITLNWRIKWELSLFRKPLVLSSITWHRGYHPFLMTTPQYHLPASVNSTSFQRRRLANLHFGPYANIPSEGLYWRAFTDHNENDLFITRVWVRLWLEVCVSFHYILTSARNTKDLSVTCNISLSWLRKRCLNKYTTIW